MAAGILRKEMGSKVEILVSCQSLKDKDFLSKSDPCCILYAERDSNWTELDRTEIIKNSINPQFSKSFDLEYNFEEAQKLRFAVYDIDNKSAKLSDDDFLGALECSLGEVVSSGVLTKPLILKNGKQAAKSTITLRANEISRQNETLTLQFIGTKLEKKDTIGKSDPFLEFSRVLGDNQFQSVYKTEVVKNDLNPKWRPFDITASKLSGGDINATIKVDCYDYENRGSHELIGSFRTTVTELMEAAKEEIRWPLINPKKKAKKKNYENSGVITLTTCQVTRDFTFLDYILGGLQINFTVGIDFTASNGAPTNPQSLHYMHPDQPNHYIRAIRAVGEVIKDYDSDQMFPALGYGAKVPPHMEVSHSFALNFNASNPFCSGIQGILDAYRTCIEQIELYGPTNFAPIILHVAQFAAAAQKENTAKNYFVLLMITDGVISDMPETLRAIVYASSLPFSIVIVGVGSADFKSMDLLDGEGDTKLKDDHGNVAKRDIVQFVAFRDYEDNAEKLAKKVLSEIPEHVRRYYKMCEIAPMVRPFTLQPAGGEFS